MNRRTANEGSGRRQVFRSATVAVVETLERRYCLSAVMCLPLALDPAGGALASKGVAGGRIMPLLPVQAEPAQPPQDDAGDGEGFIDDASDTGDDTGSEADGGDGSNWTDSGAAWDVAETSGESDGAEFAGDKSDTSAWADSGDATGDEFATDGSIAETTDAGADDAAFGAAVDSTGDDGNTVSDTTTDDGAAAETGDLNTGSWCGGGVFTLDGGAVSPVWMAGGVRGGPVVNHFGGVQEASDGVFTTEFLAASNVAGAGGSLLHSGQDPLPFERTLAGSGDLTAAQFDVTGPDGFLITGNAPAAANPTQGPTVGGSADTFLHDRNGLFSDAADDSADAAANVLA